MSEPRLEPTPRETIDELPFAGRVVAYVFLGIGLSALLKLAAYFFVRDELSVNLIDFAFLYVGWGLLRGRQDAPGCATSLVGCMGISLSLGLVLIAVFACVAVFGGEAPEIHFEPNPAVGVVAIVALLTFAFWSYGVLKRPEIRSYCDGSGERQVFRRFRMEQLFALMTMVVFAAIGLSPASKDQAPSIISGGFTTIAQNAAPISGLFYEVLESGSSQKLLHVVLVKSSVGKSPASSLDVWQETLVLEVQGSSYTLRQDARVHVLEDGRLTEGVEHITQEQWDAYRSTKPQQWSIEEIEAFLKDSATETVP